MSGRRAPGSLQLETSCSGQALDDEKVTVYMAGTRGKGTVEEGGGGPGTIIMVGGTGRFAGATGTSHYEARYLRDNGSETAMGCAWSR